MNHLETLDGYFKEQRDEHLEQLKEFLRIPSISALSEHKNDMQQAAEWFLLHSKQLDLKIFQSTKRMDTLLFMVIGFMQKENRQFWSTAITTCNQSILELWETGPFEPEVRDNKLYARGASDDKGQVFMHVKAVEALMQKTGSLPVNVKFIIEGEEEIGSPNLEKYIEANKDKLSADVIVISDTGMQGPGHPAVCYGLRGLCGVQIDVQGAKSDLHSGLYGGGVQNPIHALAEVLASFRDQEGTIAIEGFYDNVRPLLDEEREAYQALGFNEDELKEEIGVTELFGEKGYSHLERTWTRPTLEVNGVFGGFSGEGIKTVLPAEAGAKITCRLVPDQDPDEIIEKLKAHIEKHKPVGVTVTVTEFDKGKPFITPFDHPAIQAADVHTKKYTMYQLPIHAAADQFQSLQHSMKY